MPQGTARTTSVPAVAGALAAWLLASVLVGSLAVSQRHLAQSGAEQEQLQRGLAAADGAARLCATSADAAARERELQALETRHTPSFEHLFAIAAGGVDDLGIARGSECVWGARPGGAARTTALLDASKNVQAAGEAALQKGTPVDVARLLFELPDGRRALAVPYRASAQGKQIAGVAGVVLRPVPPMAVALWCWLLPFAIAAIWLFLRRASPLSAPVASVSAFLLGAAAMLAAAPPLPQRDPTGVAVLASDWLVPHAAAAGHATPSLWLPSAAGLLALLLGLCVQPLAAVLTALRKDPAPYLYVGPALVGTAVLVLVPFAVGVGLSFIDRGGEFVGLDHYAEVVRTALDPSSSTHFGRTLAMTVLWTVLNVAFHVSIGLALALVLNRPKLRGRAIYRLLLIVPWAVPSYITALTWKWLFNTQYGPLNAMLAGIGIDPVDWLGQSVTTNFVANLATNVWLGFPFMMVISLGALQSIPSELYEAADIDGASAWQKFRHVTLPLLRPALFPAVILGTIWTFNAFNVIYLVSGGGPEHKTDILITEAYYAFAVLRRTGLAAAYSVLIFLLLLGYTLITQRKTRATEAVSK